MQIEILKSKIHRVAITEANLHYMGSITIDEDLMEAANLIMYEKVTVADIDNGERFDTYVIKGERGSRTIAINGAAAHKVEVGHLIIIMAYAAMSPEEAGAFKPNLVFPDSKTNKLIS
jgi:aspartate 1-decarboxylase